MSVDVQPVPAALLRQMRDDLEAQVREGRELTSDLQVQCQLDAVGRTRLDALVFKLDRTRAWLASLLPKDEE